MKAEQGIEDSDVEVARPEFSIGERVRLCALAEQTTDLGYWRLELDTEQLLWSDKVFEIYGLDQATFAPTVDSAIECYHPDDIGAVRSMLKRAVESGEPERFDLRLVRPSGETRHVRSVAQHQPDPAGGPGVLVGTFLDITYEMVTSWVREQLEEINSLALLDGVARVQRLLELGGALVNAGRSAIVTIDPERQIETVLVSVGDVNVSIGGKEDYALPISIDGIPYGELRFYQGKSPLTVAEPQAPTASLLACMLSYELGRLTQIEHLEAAQDELRIREKEISLIFHTVPVRIWYKDDRNTILRINHTAADSMGLSVHEAEGANAYDLFPEMAAKYHKDDLKVIDSGKPEIGIVERFTPSGGEEGWVSTDKIPFVDPASRRRRLLVVSQDITALMTSQNSLEKKAEELLVANQSLDEFAYIASHDLRAPIRSIQQLTTWLAEDNKGKLSDESTRTLELIRNHVERMDTMLGDILAYSRAGRTLGDAQTINVSEAASEAWRSIENTNGFDLHVEARRANLYLPRIALQQILANLLGNAVKHHDRSAGKIYIECDDTNSGIRRCVSDDGPGIDAQHYERIFKMFETLQPRDAVEGSGIGLAIVRRMVNALGGNVTVSNNTARRGMVFCIELPPACRGS